MWYFKKLNTYRCLLARGLSGSPEVCFCYLVLALGAVLRVHKKPEKRLLKGNRQIGLNLRISCHCICEEKEVLKRGKGRIPTSRFCSKLAQSLSHFLLHTSSVQSSTLPVETAKGALSHFLLEVEQVPLVSLPLGLIPWVLKSSIKFNDFFFL